jgi:cell division protein FtsX
VKGAALVLLTATLAATACGSDHRRASAPRGECAVKLYFAPATPRARVLQLAARLRRYERVRRVDFVSKAAAARIMRQKYPDLMKSLVRNPLPDALTVWPRTDADRAAVIRALRPRPAGVHKVAWRSAAKCG